MTAGLRTNLAVELGRIAETLRTTRPGKQERKAHQDYVTDVDCLADRLVTDFLGKLSPGIPVFSEERPWPEMRPETYWIIDPIDGTGNLMSGLPFAAISAALVEGGRTVAACIAALFTDDVFSAAEGQGAWLGADRIVPSDEAAELVAVSSGILDRSMSHPSLVAELRALGKIRNLGSQALQLASVASGRLGASISEEAKLWDDAAGALIVREAGMVYRSRPVGPRPDARQRCYACHPSLAPALEALASDLWDKEHQHGATT